jgi:hypothetical protein
VVSAYPGRQAESIHAFRPKKKIGQNFTNIPGAAGFTCRAMVSIPTAWTWR